MMGSILGRLIDRLKLDWRRYRIPLATHRVVDAVKQQKLTYLSREKLQMLAHLCRMNERTGVPGAVIETGCALGGSSIVMASAKDPRRALRIYDVFDQIPPPSEKDGDDVRQRYKTITTGESKGIGGDVYYGYQRNVYDKVFNTFGHFGIDVAENNIQLIKGLIQDTLVVTSPVALAHIDVDWYEPVRISLERIEPRLSPGGALVIDDYEDWSGCRTAVDEYFSGDRMNSYSMDLSAGSLVIAKKR